MQKDCSARKEVPKLSPRSFSLMPVPMKQQKQHLRRHITTAAQYAEEQISVILIWNSGTAPVARVITAIAKTILMVTVIFSNPGFSQFHSPIATVGRYFLPTVFGLLDFVWHTLFHTSVF